MCVPHGQHLAIILILKCSNFANVKVYRKVWLMAESLINRSAAYEASFYQESTH